MNEMYWSDRLLHAPDTLWHKRPASLGGEGWKTALPLGNGITGALLYGAVGTELLRLTRHDLWAGAACTGPLPDVSVALAGMRQKMDRGNWPAAQTMLMDALRAAGYSQTIPEPFPLGQLRLEATDIDAPFGRYRRALQLDKGEAFVRWRAGDNCSLRRCFVSQADGCVWLCQQDDVPRRWELTFETCPGQGYTADQMKDTAAVQYTASGLLFTAKADGATVGAVVQILPGADCTVTNRGSYLEVYGCSFAVKVQTFTDEKGEVLPTEERKDGPDAYEKALQEHIALWQPKYADVSLVLSDERSAALQGKDNAALLDASYEDTAPAALYQKLWRFARYLFLAGTAAQGNPFPLYGLWAGDYGLPWTQHVANENVQMIYSPALAGGCFDAYRALIRYYAGYMDQFRDNAQQMFGCRGIFVPAYTAPKALDGAITAGPAVAVPVILHWISGAGWLAAGFYSYYLYTGDEETLRQHILPFLVETGRFYLDYVRWDAEGHCRIYPSVSPENTPGNLMPAHFKEEMGHVCPAVENATMDFAVMKQTLTSLLELLARPDLAGAAEPEEVAAWQRLLAGIPEYQVDTTTGAVREWMHSDLTDFEFHRHVSHLYPVFPGNEVRRDNAPDLLAAFETAARRRILGSKSGWAFAHMSALWARLGDSCAAINELDLLCKACLLENFFTLHNDWRHMGASLDLGEFAPVQLDALQGTASALQEMLVYAAGDSLRLLPALPDRFAAGSVCGMYAPQGRLDIKWSAGHGQAVLTPRADAPLTVQLPDGSSQKLQLRRGEPVTIEFALL